LDSFETDELQGLQTFGCGKHRSKYINYVGTTVILQALKIMSLQFHLVKCYGYSKHQLEY